MRPIHAPLVLLLLALSGCAGQVDVGQARVCRIALVAIVPVDANIHINGTRQVDGSSLAVSYFTSDANGKSPDKELYCQFEGRSNTVGHYVLQNLRTEDGYWSRTQLYFLQNYWLNTSAAWVSDPEPVAGADKAPALPASLAFGLQQLLNALPLVGIYALLAAAYSLVYGLVGRINLAFGEFAAIGGYAAVFGVVLAIGSFSFAAVGLAIFLGMLAAVVHGVIASRLVFVPLAKSSGQTGLVATVGLAIFLQEYLRLSQGSSPHWITPVLNAPVPVARADAFIVTVTPIALLTAGIAALAACTLLVIMKVSDFGRQWRAYADDSQAASLFGVNPDRLFAKTFALACALAGLGGCLMTLFYGAFGYGASTALGLKALIAAIVGGIGSIPGAFLGGLAIGLFEAFWQSYFQAEYRDLAVYLILVGMLMFRPGGFFGFGELRPRQV